MPEPSDDNSANFGPSGPDSDAVAFSKYGPDQHPSGAIHGMVTFPRIP